MACSGAANGMSLKDNEALQGGDLLVFRDMKIIRKLKLVPCLQSKQAYQLVGLFLLILNSW